jgi:multidrug resistance efflux pump
MTAHTRHRRGVLSAAAAAAVGLISVAVIRAGGAPTTAPATTQPTTAPAKVAAKPAPSADTTVVKRGTIHLSFDADGVFEPVDPFEVRFAFRHYQGELTIRKAVAPGATVAKGDVLLALDTDPIDRQIAAAESAATVAAAAVAKAESDAALGDRADGLAMDYAKQAAADADLDLKRWDQTDGPAAVLAGSLKSREYGDALDDASDELDQLRQMYKTEDLTNQTADIVLKRAVRTVELYKKMDAVGKSLADRASTYEPAVHRHALSAEAAQHAVSVDELVAQQAEGRVYRAAALVAARAAAAAADRHVAELKRDRASMVVTSPVDGIAVYGSFADKSWSPIEPRKLAVDESVQAEQVLITVCQPGKLRVAAACPEAWITRLPPGQRVRVMPDVLRDAAYDGTCGPAAPVASSAKWDADITVPVELATPVDPRVMAGQYAFVQVDLPPAADVLLVPPSAVYHGKVWVRDADGTDHPRPVKLGRGDGDGDEIVSGLVAGDVVLTKAKDR